MTKPYIERRHVELEEDVEYDDSVTFRTWYARLYGPLIPTKETVQMSRSAQSAGEALLLLTEALAEQGWELR